MNDAFGLKKVLLGFKCALIESACIHCMPVLSQAVYQHSFSAPSLKTGSCVLKTFSVCFQTTYRRCLVRYCSYIHSRGIEAQMFSPYEGMFSASGCSGLRILSSKKIRLEGVSGPRERLLRGGACAERPFLNVGTPSSSLHVRRESLAADHSLHYLACPNSFARS